MISEGSVVRFKDDYSDCSWYRKGKFTVTFVSEYINARQRSITQVTLVPDVWKQHSGETDDTLFDALCFYEVESYNKFEKFYDNQV